MLGTRLWLFPNIDQFRPWLVERLSTALDIPVEIGHLEARWQGWQAHLHMSDLALGNPSSRQQLTVPEAVAVVSWRSVFQRKPHFVSLALHGLDLTIQRDPQERVRVLGKTVPVVPRKLVQLPLHVPAVGWLLEQPQLQLSHGTIRWLDDSRESPAMVWRDVALSIRNGFSGHRFGLTAHASPGQGARIDIRGNLRRRAGAGVKMALDGDVYAHLSGVQPQAWKPWLNWPVHIMAENSDVQLWADVHKNVFTTLLADVRVDQAVWQHAPGVGASTTRGRTVFETTLEDWPRFETLSAQVQAQDVRLRLGTLPDIPFFAHAVSGQLDIASSQKGRIVNIDRLVLDSPDAQVLGKVHWAHQNESEGLGYLDMDIDIPWARIAAVNRYLPPNTDADLRVWLGHALHSGVVEQGKVVLQGALAAFPFDEPGAEGIFTVHAPYRQARLDYFPLTASEPGWPALHDMHGQVDIERASMAIQATEARMTPASSGEIKLYNVAATIPNMRGQATVRVSAQTEAQAPVYLELLQSSPLAALLDHAFDATRAQGQWSVPIELSIPLHSDGVVQVDGRLRMQDTVWQFDPGLPKVTQLGGELMFTQDTVQLSGLKGQLLGGAVTFSGGVGPKQSGLQMDGRIPATELARLSGVSGAKRLSGETAYVANLTGIGPSSKSSPVFEVRSSLVGMAMDFPAPLGKAAEQAMPLTVSWKHGDAPTDRVLDINVEQRLAARFAHSERAEQHAWFQAGSISVGEKAQWPEEGMSVAISQPEFDLDAWDDVTKEFSVTDTSSNNTEASTLPLFPKVRYLQLDASEARLLGMDLTDLAYRFWQDGALDWRADIRANEAVGQLAWIEMDGKPQGPVHGVFERLQIGASDKLDDTTQKGSAAADSTTERSTQNASVHDAVNIPAISLQVHNLEFYGMDLGSLTLDGVPDAAGEVWELQGLTLQAPGMELAGTGKWRLAGNNRGLTLNISAQTSNMGSYLDQIGFVDVMHGGKGEASASIRWLDLPWSMDATRLDGNIQFSINDGRLNTINSDAARLLELLSFQSMQRLARLDINPLDLTRDGFPFQILRGTLALEQGRLHTSDYQVAGPAGSIVIDGDVALDAGQLDLDAVVVPNLDVSGAAIAAGVVVNPIVGLGAFLTQWVLKEPLAEAMAVRYRIGGTWKAPVVEPQKKLFRKEPGPTTP